MTDTLFFDTDCLCAFLWVQNESLLPQLYPGKIVVPKPVYTELCRPNTPHLKARVDALVAKGQVTIQEIDVTSEEYQTYYQLTEAPEAGHKIIGNGEAASISLAKHYGGIVASNNFRDIQGSTDLIPAHIFTPLISADLRQKILKSARIPAIFFLASKNFWCKSARVD